MRRPRKPGLDSIKERNFSKRTQGLKHQPNRIISNRIDSKLFSLDENRLYHYKPDLLAAEEYKRCLALFERRLPYESGKPTLQATGELAKRIEMSIKPYMEAKELVHTRS